MSESVPLPRKSPPSLRQSIRVPRDGPRLDGPSLDGIVSRRPGVPTRVHVVAVRVVGLGRRGGRLLDEDVTIHDVEGIPARRDDPSRAD